MIVDLKADYRRRRLVLIDDGGGETELPMGPAYFYAIVPKGKEGVLERLLNGEGAWVEPTNFKPVVYAGERYVVSDKYSVVKVCTENPREVPRLAEALKGLNVRIAAHNVRYTVRQSFDNDVHYFDIIPLYWGLDREVIDKLRKVKMVVFDVEAEAGKPILVSALVHTPFEEVRRDNVASFKLPEEADEFVKLVSKYGIVAGHNIVGFDIPVLRRAGIDIGVEYKLVFDNSVVLATYGNSLKVGSARSLLDVATILAKDAGITQEELELKRKVHGVITGISWEELVRYNQNDVVLTAKLLNIFFPFIAVVSALTQIPPSDVIQLPAGMVAEYFALRTMELSGYVPEYRPTNVRLRGERVWLYKEGYVARYVVQTDVKMMYPSFVLAKYIDPTLHVKDDEFDRRVGPGFIYSTVKRLAELRSLSKKLRKKNPLFEPVDAGIKAILNALAYGVQGKQSGDAMMGNPWCPAKIFYGTREAQFKTIGYLQSKGYKVVYSDTDSFFIEFQSKPSDEEVARLVQTINDYMRQWGLEVDVEDVWDAMYIYRKKNYVLRKGDVVVIKGSALHNLDRYYLPECISLGELLRINDKREREKYVEEVVMSASIEDLFVRGHQQIWRLIGLDVQRAKRLGERKSRYMTVLTPWAEKPIIILKKGHIGHFMLPHSNPIFGLVFEHGTSIELSELNPLNIIELRSLRIEGRLVALRARHTVYDLLVFLDKLYTMRIKGIYYVVNFGGKTRRIPTRYEGTYPERPVGTVEGVELDVEYKEVSIDEDVLRRVVLAWVKDRLREYNLL